MSKNPVTLKAPQDPSATVVRGTNLQLQITFDTHVGGNQLYLQQGDYWVTLTGPADAQILVAKPVKPIDLRLLKTDPREVHLNNPNAHPAPTSLVLDVELETVKLVAAQHTFEFQLQRMANQQRQVVAKAAVSLLVTDPQPAGVSRTISSKAVTAIPWTDEAYLYAVIKHSSAELSFERYKDCLDLILCGDGADAVLEALKDGVKAPPSVKPAPPPGKPFVERRFLPFNDTDAYRILKVATEAFVAVKSGVCPADAAATNAVPKAVLDQITLELTPVNPPSDAADQFAKNYLRALHAGGPAVLPYYHRIRKNMGGDLKSTIFPSLAELAGDPGYDSLVKKCDGVLVRKLTCPIMVELIWSYWHEQGMQVQTMFALRDRFQNKRSPVGPDPLAAFEMSHLRPLNNILWGYIQDEQHRLTLTRRAYEYDHHYGLKLHGSAVPPMQTADSRSRFLEAFHNLLTTCVGFFKEDDDTNIKADAFPVLNALKEVHFLLSEGAHNQYGDLPTTSRIEMLMEQWILARPEMQRFLPYRESIAYPEDWMGTVDAMKAIQGWTNTSVIYFHDLANFGEQILLSIRFNNWSQVIDRNSAAAWARVWRSEIQGYMHAYRTVTGVDLAMEAKDAPRLAERNLDPSVLLQRRYDEQKRLGQATRGGMRLPGVPTAGLPAPRPAPRSALRTTRPTT